MLWVDLTRVRVYHIVVDEHLIPRSDKIGVGIISDLKISVHAKETGDSTISGIMKCHAIQTVVGSVAQEILVLARGKICCSEKSGGELGRSPASATEKGNDRSLAGLRSKLRSILTNTASQKYRHQLLHP